MSHTHSLTLLSKCPWGHLRPPTPPVGLTTRPCEDIDTCDTRIRRQRSKLGRYSDTLGAPPPVVRHTSVTTTVQAPTCRERAPARVLRLPWWPLGSVEARRSRLSDVPHSRTLPCRQPDNLIPVSGSHRTLATVAAGGYSVSLRAGWGNFLMDLSRRAAVGGGKRQEESGGGRRAGMGRGDGHRGATRGDSIVLDPQEQLLFRQLTAWAEPAPNPAHMHVKRDIK